MRKIAIASVFFVVSSYCYSLEKNFTIEPNIFFGGLSFTGINIYGEYQPGKISYILDSSFIYSRKSGTNQYTYFSSIYIKFKLLKEEPLSIDGVIGLGISQSWYDSSTYGVVFSPNLGVKLVYKISLDGYLDMRFPIFLYQDGASIPWNIGYKFPISKNMFLNLGIYGLTSFLITTQSGIVTSINIAGRIGIKYEF
jgi:hypothetical protein